LSVHIFMAFECMVKLLVYESLLQTSNPSVLHLLVTLGTNKVLGLVVLIHF
jgi:hypothetical protein